MLWDAAVGEAEVGTSNKLVPEMAIDPGKIGGNPKKSADFWAELRTYVFGL